MKRTKSLLQLWGKLHNNEIDCNQCRNNHEPSWSSAINCGKTIVNKPLQSFEFNKFIFINKYKTYFRIHSADNGNTWEFINLRLFLTLNYEL